ncbi:MAG: DUF6702 family protein [Bacteroidota bacterium]
MLSFLLIPICLLAPSEKYDHAIYISVLEIDHREMRVKVFTDNLQDAIRNDSGYFTNIGEEAFLTIHKSAIHAYFQRKIQLKINDQNVVFHPKEATVEGNSYWFTFSLEPQKEWKSFYLKADYLMELFPEQINIVNVHGRKPQFFKLTKLSSSYRFKL